jgi:hypothetical protein
MCPLATCFRFLRVGVWGRRHGTPPFTNCTAYRGSRTTSGLWDSIDVESYPEQLVQAHLDETLVSPIYFIPDPNRLHSFILSQALQKKLNGSSYTFSGMGLECFVPGYLSRAPSSSPSAWPPSRRTEIRPTVFGIDWTSPADDALGLTPTVAYPNYAAWWTPLEDLYGANLPVLKELKKKYDPKNIMGLAGGWKL